MRKCMRVDEVPKSKCIWLLPFSLLANPNPPPATLRRSMDNHTAHAQSYI
jgi:hypothetical protein